MLRRGGFDLDHSEELVVRARSRVASLLGVATHEVALCGNTSQGNTSPPSTPNASSTAMSASPAMNPDESSTPALTARVRCSDDASRWSITRCSHHATKPPTKIAEVD